MGQRVPRREALALGLVLAVALALRVAYILSRRGDILFDYPVVDEETYVGMARRMAEGGVAQASPWFQPPGLVYALAAIFRVCGPGLLAPRLVQALVSTASCGLAFVITRRFFSARIGIAVAAICAVHGILVFETYELLPPTWMLAADLVALWALLRAGDDQRPGVALGAGAALGVAAVFGPTVLPFAAVAGWWLRKPPLVGAFAVGLALAIAPVTVGNWERGHELVLVSTNGGVNFYIGNNEHYDDTLAIRPGRHWDELRDRPYHFGVKSEGASSAWYYAQGLAFWREHPARAAALYLRKLYLYFDGPEIPRDTDVQTLRSGPLAALVMRGPPFVPDGVLLPLAVVGMALSWKDRRRLALLYGFVAFQALVVAAFFVTSRYRVPAVPVLAMFACEAVRRAVEAWRSGGTVVARAAPLAACVLLAPVLNLPVREAQRRFGAELDFYRGLELRTYRHDAPSAVPFFELATHEDPSDARYWLELGNTLEALGRPRDAVAAWERAGQVDPWDARPRRKAAGTLARLGDLDGAIAVAEANIESRTHDDAFYAPDHMSLVLLHVKRGIPDRALAELAAAAHADPGWFRANIADVSRAALASPPLDAPELWRALADADDDAGAHDVASLARARIEVR